MCGLHQFWGVSGQLFVKYCVLGILRAQNGDFRALAPYDFGIVVYKLYQNVLIICRNMLIYGLHQFWGVCGPLFVKYCILGYLEGPKSGFSGLSSIRFWYCCI